MFGQNDRCAGRRTAEIKRHLVVLKCRHAHGGGKRQHRCSNALLLQLAVRDQTQVKHGFESRHKATQGRVCSSS